jgi:hypothetical protein
VSAWSGEKGVEKGLRCTERTISPGGSCLCGWMLEMSRLERGLLERDVLPVLDQDEGKHHCAGLEGVQWSRDVVGSR